MLCVLECGHIRPQTVQSRSALWCPWCHESRMVTGHSDGWSVRCRTCTFARRFGMAKLSAERAADRHHRTHPDHVVSVLLGHREKSTRTNYRQLALPFTEDAPF